ncbi:histidine kinase [Thermanaerovibrio acidaminovorans DSM 6589]|uniref:histidine kinase n=1 Tax=Thermanaerovibrio acidaminovorans (strain ATCC 49978 / DSM 6589 / Su883) TaxID=525903 RepID=D1B7X6_THEAS|nr:HAMP domain-containing sensor histidine kinase [Thermanaerovibrio acidaminovorans]ACZ18379.1 histidine kinase [Thermanaerovibrio acidaminovorans DSM 6589]
MADIPIRIRRPISLWVGMGLILFWALSLRMGASWILEALDRASRGLSVGDLALGALRLVAINSGRALMLYGGWFALGLSLKGGIRSLWGFVVILLGVPLSYGVSWGLMGGPGLHFGTSALASLVAVLVLRWLTQGLKGWLDRLIVMALLVLAIQWLDICPSLTPYGFGGGELSMGLKAMASVMGEGVLFDWIGFLGFALSLVGAVGSASITMGKVLQERQFRLIRSQERRMAQLREEGRRARVFRELQGLVHDLRRPLTVIMGLGDVLMAERPGDERLVRMMASAEGMDRMIREILSGDAAGEVRLRDLYDLVLSQVSPMPYRGRIFEAGDEAVGGLVIRANLMRLARALTNLLDNAANAYDGPVEFGGRRVDRGVELFVLDRGPGFGVQGQEVRFGTGLTFVEQVARDHGGSFQVRTPEGGGCEAVIFLPLVEVDGDAADRGP